MTHDVHRPAGILPSIAEIWVKQIALGELNEFEQIALKSACVGYADDTTPPEVLTQRKAEMESIVGPNIESQIEDQAYRRFAGDHTLTRGHYYSLARDSSGDDGGTLLNELRTYYRPELSGIVQFYDSTLANDRDALVQAGIPVEPEPGLYLHFVSTKMRPNPFIRFAGLSLDSTVVRVPISVDRLRVCQVVDLREPSTAWLLARQLTEITWQLDGLEIPAFMNLPKQDSFKTLIPSLLEQNMSGTDFTDVIGLWMRHNGIHGLIYPSARADARVEVRKGVLTSWAGFNYVSYEGIGNPEAQAFFHIASRLPQRVRFCPLLSTDPLIELPRVSVHFNDDGEHARTWRVEGLRDWSEITYLLGTIGHALEELSDRALEIKMILFDWLRVHLPSDLGKSLAKLLFHVLLERGPDQATLHRFIRDTLRQSTGEDDMQLIGALMDIERIAEHGR